MTSNIQREAAENRLFEIAAPCCLPPIPEASSSRAVILAEGDAFFPGIAACKEKLETFETALMRVRYMAKREENHAASLLLLISPH